MSILKNTTYQEEYEVKQEGCSALFDKKNIRYAENVDSGGRSVVLRLSLAVGTQTAGARARLRIHIHDGAVQ